MKALIFTITVFLEISCLNLRQAQAQTPAAPTGAALPAPILSVTPVSGSPVTEAKYYEYQSYCRGPLQLKKTMTEPEYVAQKTFLLKAFIDAKNFTNFEPLFNFSLESSRIKDAQTLFNGEKSAFTLSKQTLLQARLLTANGKFREATALLDKFSIANPNDVAILVELSKSHHKMKNFFEAKTALEDALKLDKKNSAKYIYDLCALHAEDASHSDVDVVCGKAAQLFQKDSLPLIYIGMSQRERENYREAQRQFESALKIEKTEYAMTCLAEVFLLQKKYSESLTMFKQASEFEPRSGRAQLGAAQSLYEFRKYAEALPFYLKACELDRTTLFKLREAYKPLEAEKAKISNDYFQAIQKCSAR